MVLYHLVPYIGFIGDNPKTYQLSDVLGLLKGLQFVTVCLLIVTSFKLFKCNH